MKRTELDLDEFTTSCLEYQREWGLMSYDLAFDWCKVSDAYASITVDEDGCVATVRLGRVVRDVKKCPPIRMLAKHEMCHLLMNRLYWLGLKRHVSESELDVEFERLAVVLEKIL